jgi:Fe2+ transport system protein FeoA
MEQGILPGTELQIIMEGNPLVCKLRNFRLTLSAELSDRILMESA